MHGCSSYNFSEKPEWFIQQKHGQDRQLAIIILRCKRLFILIHWKYRQGFEKPLHNFKQIICKYEKHVQKAGLQPAVNQSVIKLFVKGAWLGFKRALVTRRKSTCCRSVRPLLEARRACAALHCMKTVYKCRWYGNRLSVEDGKTCRWTFIVSICLSRILFWVYSLYKIPSDSGRPCPASV